MISLHLTAAIRAAEQAHAVELRSGILMDRAAHGLYQAVVELMTAARGGIVGARVLVLVGAGNNGGDALYAGAKLARRGARVDAISATQQPHPGGAAALLDAGGQVMTWPSGAPQQLFLDAEVLLDGLLGIGARGELREPIADIARAARQSQALVVAVDVPSGLDADTGWCASDTLFADQTITFGGLKPGLVVLPGKQFAGGVRVIDIGIGAALDSCGSCLEADDVAQWVPEPTLADYKYRRGVVGLVAGSPRYPGAAFLTTAAASAADIGMVEYLDRADGLAPQVIAAHPPVVMTSADPASNERIDAWAIGPGFSGDEGDAQALAAILRCPVPVVIDAGALAVLAQESELRDAVRSRLHATVLTPHEGEFARLCSAPIAHGRIAAARELAESLQSTVVLKGSGTVIAGPDDSLFIDLHGPAALGTAGSGDVLTGVLGALMAGAAARSSSRVSSAHAAEIAAAACWLHSAAGRLASLDGRPVTAVQLINALPGAVSSVRRPARMSL